jgi:glycosyltransferase involved in cell wall biosynthesis
MLPVPPIGYGGIERIVDGLVREYRRRGHVVGLAALGTSSASVDALFPWPATDLSRPLSHIRNAWALRKAVNLFRPDVLHSFSRLGYLLPVLRSALPKIMSYQRHTGGRQLRWANQLAGPSLTFTGCSEYIAAMGRRAGGEWHAVPNFVDPANFTFVPSVPADAPLVFLSRVESIKGPDLAIAIARASNRRLVIAGNRPTSGKEVAFWHRAIAPHLGHDGIEYVGEVDDTAKNTWLGRAACLLVPIQWDEPFGIVFAEALAAGAPIITCRRGATPEIVDSGRTGFFISTIEDGVTAVSRLPGLNRYECRRAAEERFSATACSQRYENLYYRTIGRNSPAPPLDPPSCGSAV